MEDANNRAVKSNVYNVQKAYSTYTLLSSIFIQDHLDLRALTTITFWFNNV